MRAPYWHPPIVNSAGRPLPSTDVVHELQLQRLRGAIAIDLEAAQKPGAYGYECPICKRGLRFGVVQRLMHVVLSGEAKGPGLDQDGTYSF